MDDHEAFNHFVAGFVSGEGSFFVSTRSSSAHKLGIAVTCGFSIKVRVDDRELIDLVWRALGFAGSVYEIQAERYRYADDEPIKRNDAVMLMARKRTDLTERVIPFFDTYPLRGRKRESYELWKDVVQMMERGEHVTQAGLETIMEIKAQMNRY